MSESAFKNLVDKAENGESNQWPHVDEAFLWANTEINQLRQKLEAAEAERDTYKEDVFQLRQNAENWSTKLGFVASAINSRNIGVSEKERDFPHLLIERLHTESQLYKQKFERSESALREAREQKPAGKIVNWIDARRAIVCGDGIASSPPNAAVFLSPVPAMPVQDDNLAVLVVDELYNNGGSHESQIDEANRLIRLIGFHLFNQINAQPEVKSS